jgi:hypothetical protein
MREPECLRPAHQVLPSALFHGLAKAFLSIPERDATYIVDTRGVCREWAMKTGVSPVVSLHPSCYRSAEVTNTPSEVQE